MSSQLFFMEDEWLYLSTCKILEKRHEKLVLNFLQTYRSGMQAPLLKRILRKSCFLVFTIRYNVNITVQIMLYNLGCFTCRKKQ